MALPRGTLVFSWHRKVSTKEKATHSSRNKKEGTGGDGVRKQGQRWEIQVDLQHPRVPSQTWYMCTAHCRLVDVADRTHFDADGNIRIGCGLRWEGRREGEREFMEERLCVERESDNGSFACLVPSSLASYATRISTGL